MFNALLWSAGCLLLVSLVLIGLKTHQKSKEAANKIIKNRVLSRSELSTNSQDRILFALLAAACIFLCALVWVAWVNGMSFSELSRDPLAVANAPIYYGILSNVGILFWCAGATSAFIAFAYLNRAQPGGEFAQFFLLVGIGTFVLCLDDLFLLHERVLPLFGIWENYLFLSYFLVAILLGVYFRHIIIAGSLRPLMLSLCFFSISIAADKLDKQVLGSLHHIIEDGCKFFGIVCWASFLIQNTLNSLTQVNVQPGERMALDDGKIYGWRVQPKLNLIKTRVSASTEGW